MHAPVWAASASRSPYPWRLFSFLLVSSILGILAVVPYLRVVLGPTLRARPLPLPLPALVAIQGAINFGLAIGLGLLIARQLGLGAPLLENWLYGRRMVAPAHTCLIAALIGFGLGLVTLAVIRSPLGAALSHLPIATQGSIPVWKRFLACFYGGICEETLLRLFLLSLVLWLFRFLGKVDPASGSLLLFWIANVLVAVAFGAGHLPLAAKIAPLTLPVVVSVVALNALVALPFGWLYGTRGPGGGHDRALLWRLDSPGDRARHSREIEARRARSLVTHSQR